MVSIRTPVNISRLRKRIEHLYNRLQESGDLWNWTERDYDTIEEAIGYLDRGHVRVADKKSGEWKINDWTKKIILLYFKTQKINVIEAGDLTFADKIPVKQWRGDEGVRVVPPALVRRGSYIGNKCILMPSFVNIGAYVGEGTMVDTWATVGSCAQIGRHVHLSGGVGIGGVLEPLQAAPVIVEDNVFVGSRCVVVEGIIIEEGSVIGAGVVLTASTRIIDVSGATPITMRGRIPRNSVVIPGITSKDFPAGTVGVPCALIIGKRNESTDKKVSLNQALRDFEISI